LPTNSWPRPESGHRRSRRTCAILTFLLPVDLRRAEFRLSREATTRIPWGVLILIGSGFSLANAVQTTAVDDWVAVGLVTLFSLLWLALVPGCETPQRG
jgi:sodium-dependent dicarboxylate transporter 2/3/5